jgi:hypothetical protein
MSRPLPAYRANSFGLVLFLVGRGHEPTGAELAQDGTGKVVYLFPMSVRDELDRFHDWKDRLNAMGLAARQATHLLHSAGERIHGRPTDQS